MEKTKNKILVLTTGGTIACEKTKDGYSPENNGGAFASSLQQYIPKNTKVVVKSVFNKDSSELRVGDWENLAKIINENQLEYDSIIVFHGTDTMESALPVNEFMFYNPESNLKRNQSLVCPVIFTGSMIPNGELNSDAPTNIKTAFNTANYFATNQIPGFFLAFNKEVHDGLHFRKEHPSNIDAFTSNGHVIANETQDGEIILTKFGEKRIDPNVDRESIRLQTTPHSLNKMSLDPYNVNLFTYTPQGVIFPEYRPSLAGIIVKGLGAGNLPKDFANMARERVMNNHLPIVMTSKYAFQRVEKTYDLAMYAEKGGIILSPEIRTPVLQAKITFMIANEISGVYNLSDFQKWIHHPYLGEIKQRPYTIQDFIQNPAKNKKNNFEELLKTIRSGR